MVFLAITSRGLEEALQLSKIGIISIWCGADAIAEDSYEGLDVSRFNYSLANESTEVMQGVLDTIAEHHPGESIWIEQVDYS